jgi:hypothetical protein
LASIHFYKQLSQSQRLSAGNELRGGHAALIDAFAQGLTYAEFCRRCATEV